MPTYDYRCEACDHEFEQFQSITANALRKCPACGKMKLRRLIGAGAGIIFKGSGFYETDYRSDSYKKQAKAEKESGTKSSGESKGDTKKSDASSTTSTDKAEKKPAKKTTSTES
ncbi:MAG: zinc ribbon domain-containing protein [Phycisphaeraceae bacterium]